jgi:hypothetical protein
MLELTKAATFFACLFSLYWGTLSAFFVLGPHWQDRFFLLLAKLALAAAVCLLSALIFRLPISSNPDANQPITSTLPMKLFFWAAPILLFLFVASWYLTCGAPTFTTHYPACS